MKEVVLSKAAVLGALMTYWGTVEFPDHVYIALETCAGFGESDGGFGLGGVVNTLTDMESGIFLEMARIDELVLNIPDRETVRAHFAPRKGAAEPVEITPEMERWFLQRYDWKLTDRVRDTRIQWE